MRTVVSCAVGICIVWLAIGFSGCPFFPQPEPGSSRAFVLFTAGSAEKQGVPVELEDIEHFYLTITEVGLDYTGNSSTGTEEQGFDGQKITAFSGEVELDLLHLTSLSQVLADVDLPAGAYTRIRLSVSNPRLYLATDPGTEITNVQIAANNHIFVTEGFELPEDGTRVIALDLGGIALTMLGNGGFTLTPQLRVALAASRPVTAAGDIATLDIAADRLGLDLDDGSLEVSYTAETLIAVPQDPPAVFSGTEADLAVGQPARIEGTLAQSGTLMAESIRTEFVPGSMDANEASARAILCQIVEAEYAYAAIHGEFIIEFSALSDIPNVSEPVNGYNFVLGGNESQFTVHASPVAFGETGEDGYFVDETRLIRFEVGADATAASAPYGETCSAAGPEIANNEAAAQSILCQIVRAEHAYAEANGEFAISFGDLSGLPDLSVTVLGYYFVLGGDSSHFYVNANAAQYGVTGNVGYYADETGVVRFAFGEDAFADSPMFGLGCAPAEAEVIANEVSARALLCQIVGAEYAYFTAHNEFTSDFGELVGLPDLSGTINGYNFVLAGNPFLFTVSASPDQFGVTGVNAYYTDYTAVLRFAPGRDANPIDPWFGETCTTEENSIPANESSARAILCQVHAAQAVYFEANGTYATDLGALQGLPDLSEPTNGYEFVLESDGAAYTMLARPVVFGTTGIDAFLTDHSGVVRYEVAADAVADSPEFGTVCPRS